MAESAYKPDATLLFALTMLKSHEGRISDLSARIAALSETVRTLDPTFDEILRQKTEDVEKTLASSKQTLLDQYDTLLEAIRTGNPSLLEDESHWL